MCFLFPRCTPVAALAKGSFSQPRSRRGIARKQIEGNECEKLGERVRHARARWGLQEDITINFDQDQLHNSPLIPLSSFSHPKTSSLNHPKTTNVSDTIYNSWQSRFTALAMDPGGSELSHTPFPAISRSHSQLSFRPLTYPQLCFSSCYVPYHHPKLCRISSI